MRCSFCNEIHFPSFPSAGGISISTYTLEAFCLHRLLTIGFPLSKTARRVPKSDNRYHKATQDEMSTENKLRIIDETDQQQAILRKLPEKESILVESV